MNSHDTAAAEGARAGKSGSAPASLPPSTPTTIRDAYNASFEWAKKTTS
jgi:hypothetical protein